MYRWIFLVVLLLAGCASTTPTQTELLNNAPRAEPVPPPVATSPIGHTLSSGAWPADAPVIFADSAIMIDAQTGRVLYEKNADKTRPVASTQKLLTALVVLDKGNMQESIRISPSDTQVEPTNLGLRAGETYTKEKLLGVILVKSCNDAAAALGRSTSGSIPAFSMDMNRKAWELGARNSHFVNPHGLPAAGQYSTARDMSRIAFAAYRQPLIRQYAQMRSLSFTLNSGRTVNLAATNKLLSRSPIYTGLKTGYTVASGRCLVTTAHAGGTDVILVQLGSKTDHIFNDAQVMVNWQQSRGFRGFASQ